MEWVVTIHNYWRWVVLLVGLAAIVYSVMALSGSRPWDAVADRLALYFTIAMDVQLLIGIIVWIFEQRWSDGLFLGYIHPIAMIAAVALAHVGRRRSDQVTQSREKGRQATIFFVASFIVIVVAIPIGAWPL